MPPCVIRPTKPSIDFRAACFCHGKAIEEYGFVCSECLSGASFYARETLRKAHLGEVIPIMLCVHFAKPVTHINVILQCIWRKGYLCNPSDSGSVGTCNTFVVRMGSMWGE